MEAGRLIYSRLGWDRSWLRFQRRVVIFRGRRGGGGKNRPYYRWPRSAWIIGLWSAKINVRWLRYLPASRAKTNIHGRLFPKIYIARRETYNRRGRSLLFSNHFVSRDCCTTVVRDTVFRFCDFRKFLTCAFLATTGYHGWRYHIFLSRSETLSFYGQSEIFDRDLTELCRLVGISGR